MPFILCLYVSLRSVKDAPISDFSDEIFPYVVWKKDITAIKRFGGTGFAYFAKQNYLLSQIFPAHFVREKLRLNRDVISNNFQGLKSKRGLETLDTLLNIALF